MTAASVQQSISDTTGGVSKNVGNDGVPDGKGGGSRTPDRSSPQPSLAPSGSPVSSNPSPTPSPEPIVSSSSAVPNPFANIPDTIPRNQSASHIPQDSNGSATTGRHNSTIQSNNASGIVPAPAPAMPPATSSPPINVPNPFQAQVSNKPAIASSGIRVPHLGVSTASAAVGTSTSQETSFATGGNGRGPPSVQEGKNGNLGGTAAASEPPYGSPKFRNGDGKGRSTGAPNRRQKRLERNRESARLSRRRRKQYLEVLEERVTTLSDEMDRGRRLHVTKAIPELREKRTNALNDGTGKALLEEMGLSRTSDELRVASTFQCRQMQSMSFPPHMKFILWLSLQNDVYFRGGRAASERLSAARIGERVSTSRDQSAFIFIASLSRRCSL